MSKWHKFTGRYMKRPYDAQLSDGSLLQVWPNAGKLAALDGSGRHFTVADGVLIRPAKEFEYFSKEVSAGQSPSPQQSDPPQSVRKS
jgi:hypothetical protein